MSILALALTSAALAPQGGFENLLHLESGRSRRASSGAADPDSNRDNLRVAPGGTHTLAELEGPGVIRHIWLTFPAAAPSWLARDGGARPDEIVLRMYWDGAEHPAVEVPVGDFFATGFGHRYEVCSLVVQVEDGDSYNCWWPMPFFRSARITLSNQSEKPLNSTYFHIDYEQRELPEATPYFCARYGQAFPAPAGVDLTLLDVRGKGHYVGTVLSVRSRSPSWFGEGDERFYIDGEDTPSIHGTGTEDYFLSAWGFSSHTFPYSGTRQIQGSGPEALGAVFSSYRWHLHDPVRFQQALRLTIEHKGWVPGDERPDGKVHGHTERFDDFAWVAFWYQMGQPAPFPPLPGAAQRVPPNLDRITEGRALLAEATMQGGTTELQKGYPWTGDGQVFFRSPGEGEVFLEVPFRVEQEEYRALVLPLTRSYDYGKWRILLDGEVLAREVDLYDPETRLEEVVLGSRTLPAGRHVLRFELTGRHPESTGYYLGLDSVRLRERVPPRDH